jgi:hypothetical protein
MFQNTIPTFIFLPRQIKTAKYLSQTSVTWLRFKWMPSAIMSISNFYTRRGKIFSSSLNRPNCIQGTLSFLSVQNWRYFPLSIASRSWENYSVPSSMKVRNIWACDFIVIYAFMEGTGTKLLLFLEQVGTPIDTSDYFSVILWLHIQKKELIYFSTVNSSSLLSWVTVYLLWGRNCILKYRSE